MKTKILLTLLLGSAFTGAAYAQFVNLATPTTPAPISAFFTVEGFPENWVDNTVDYPNPATLVDGGSVTFRGTNILSIPGLSFELTIFDGPTNSDPAATTQAIFTINNSSGGFVPVPANALSFGISGLFDQDGGTIDPVFDFVRADDATIASYFKPSYDLETGTFTFTNDTTFVLQSVGALTFTGNFEASGAPIPEPSTYAALAGVLGFAFVVWQRRRRQLIA